MKLLLLMLWWWLPTAIIAERLRAREPNAVQRWAVAFVVWMIASGVWIFALTHAIGHSALSFKFGTLPILAIASISLITLRRRSAPQVIPLAAFDGLPFARFSASVIAFTALIALLSAVIAGVFSSGVSISGRSSEVFAYASFARAWSASHVADFGVIPDLFASAMAAPLPAWAHLSDAIASTGWTDWGSRLRAFVLWLVVGAWMMSRVSLATRSMPVAGLVLLCIAFQPALFTLINRNSDVAIVAALAAGCAAAFVAPQRYGNALIFAVAAFLWSPTLGWPVALAACIKVAINMNGGTRTRAWAGLAIGGGLIATLVALQAERFLPTFLRAGINAQSNSPLTWQTFSAGDAMILLLLAAGTALVINRNFALRRGGDQSPWLFVALLCPFCLVAMQLKWPSYLAATDRGSFSLALVLCAPSLVVYFISSLFAHVQTLSEYVSVETSVAATAAESTAQNEAEVTQPILSIDEMRARLLIAYDHYGNGQLPLATQVAQEVLDSDAQHPDAHHLFGLIALTENRPGDALRSVLRALDVFPEHALFHLTVADIYGAQSRWAEQAMALSEASRLDPTNINTKTKLLLAKRKSLMAQAQGANIGDRTRDADRNAYEILVNRKS